MMMSRPVFIVAAALAMLASGAAHGADDAPRRPNVLMIVIDDLNDWLGCMGGHPQAVTPNIDRLAARGVLFTNAHCQAPICKPSRDSFMTGRLPSTTGIYLLGGFHFRKTPALADAVALPEYFARHGYVTMGAGKIYHTNAGHDTFQSYGPRGGFGPRPARKISQPHGHPLWDWGAFPERDDQLADTMHADWAVEQLGKEFDKPFFMAVGFVRPHVPMYVPQKWFDQLPAEPLIDLPPVLVSDRADLPEYGQRLTYGGAAPRHEWVTQANEWRHAVRAYLACIAYVDHQVGRILDALDASGHADDTIVVLFSDHGFHLGEKQRWAKRSLWERSTRVPLIVAAPQMGAGVRGAECGEPAGLIDVYPTLAALCGLPAPEGLEGVSLAAQCADPTTPRDTPVLTTFWVNNHSLRDRRYRFTRYADGSRELYDHAHDPHEWKNVADDPAYAPVIERLSAFLPTVNADPVPGNSALGVREEDRAAFKVKD